ncbi:MAG: ROK family transcriptional regulator [Deltaproteobacteria bacterium]
MDVREIKIPGGGANQAGQRDHNERLIMSLIQRHGALPGIELARATGLSAQTVSIILRRLEGDGLLVRGESQKGRVGKPSVPMALNRDGAFSIGLKIGRRTTDLVLTDITGARRGRSSLTYSHPRPGKIMDFLEAGIGELTASLPENGAARLAGLGIGMPFQLWDWHELISAPKDEMAEWRDFDFARAIAEFSSLPVWVENDATTACRAEHVFGRGRERLDYAYFFIGSFIGGGVVLNHSVYAGHHGNAGSFGSLPIGGTAGALIDAASIYLLETSLLEAKKSTATLWGSVQDWSDYEPELELWLTRTAEALAIAVVAVCAVIDFECVVIDGAFPSDVRDRLVTRVAAALPKADTRGVILPEIAAGTVGHDARAIGASTLPFNAKFFLNTNPIRGGS